MKKALILLSLLLITFGSFAQKFEYGIEISPFFDNTEFGGSTIIKDQTMAGTRFSAEVGLRIDTIHHLHLGVTELQEFGSPRDVDYHNLIAYYNYNKAPFKFYMGAFPRQYATRDYSRVFFQDSILFYRPIMTGLMWELYKNKNYFNVWLDWTNRQSETQREAFFMGWSGYYQTAFFYLKHTSYMRHYAKTLNAPADQYIYDNGLSYTGFGMDFSEYSTMDVLNLGVGWLCGLEDNRGTTNWMAHNAMIFDVKLEYKGLGLNNSLYAGAEQMNFYNEQGNKLYWGDPVYRSKNYNRTDVFIKFLESDFIKTKFVYTLHSIEGKVYHEQGLYVSMDINNYKKKSNKKYQFLWDNWFDGK